MPSPGLTHVKSFKKTIEFLFKSVFGAIDFKAVLELTSQFCTCLTGLVILLHA